MLAGVKENTPALLYDKLPLPLGDCVETLKSVNETLLFPPPPPPPVLVNVILSPASLVVIVIPLPATNVSESAELSATTLFCPDTKICLNALVAMSVASSPIVNLLLPVSVVTVILPSPLISTFPFSSTNEVVPFVTVTLASNPLVLEVSTLAIKASTCADV